MHIPDKEDVLAAHEIYNFIKAQIPEQSNAKVYISAVNHRNIVHVYGLTDEASQEKIIAALGGKIEATKWEPLAITFYKTENWIDQGTQRRVRGQEEIITTLLISRKLGDGVSREKPSD